jgi:xanthine dehydrogenase FAD-binding subunit
MVTSWNPSTIEEALKIKKENPDAVPYAGGSDWMVVRNEKSRLLFLNQIPSLKEIAQDENEVRIGAGCTYADLLQCGEVPGILKTAVSGIAAPAIRNVGTLGGNICNASPAGDTLPVLYVLDAQVALASLNEENRLVSRVLPVAEFIHGVRRTDLRPEELLAQVIIPKESFTHVYYQKVGARNAQAISKLSFAALARAENGVIADFRAAFGSVGITAVRKKELEALVIGKSCSELDREEILRKYSEVIRPIDDQRSTAVYRKKVCLNLLGDFLQSLR